MTTSSSQTPFHIQAATEENWPWIMEGHVESAWQSLSPERQSRVTRQIVHECLSTHVARTRGPEGSPNQAFVAKDEKGREAGFIWVAEFPRGFTGEHEAFVLDVYVDERHRGSGLGGRLMETGEEWAREQGMQGIALNVASHNAPARKLYERLGYQIESVQMSKRLDLEHAA